MKFFLGCRLDSGLDSLRTVRHLGNLLQNYRIVYGLMGIPAPCKRTMVLAQHRMISKI